MLMHREDKLFLPNESDGQLAKRACDGDESAFEELVKRYSPSLFHYIYHLLGDYDRSCDVLQQVMIQFYRSLPTLHRERPFKPWLYQVAHHQTIDETRRKRLTYFSEMENTDAEEQLITITDLSPLPEEQLENAELQQQLRRALVTLPERFRDIVALRYLGQLTFSEIGQAVGVPAATAKTYFQRAKPLLRAALHANHLSELLPGTYR